VTRPEEWFTVTEAAALCRRSPKTIDNLLSKHQLPRRLMWKTVRRLRRRVIFLAPPTVAYLQRITLYGESPQDVQKPSRMTQGV
jgi:hypothetical protein